METSCSSASKDGTLCLWNGETGEILTKFEENNSSINCMAITGTKDLLMTGAEDGEWLFGASKPAETADVLGAHIRCSDGGVHITEQGSVSCCRHHMTGASAFESSTHPSGSLHTEPQRRPSLYWYRSQLHVHGEWFQDRSWLRSLSPSRDSHGTLVGHTASITSLRVFPDSSRCVTGSRDQTIRVWTIDDARCNAVLHTDEPVLACDVNYNNIILYGTEGGWVSTAAYQSDLSKPNTLVSQLI
ncbi:hypothetical protein GBAR_LOCUS15503 [Geodia barretti]|uniref:Uncharacterized protein n=1 Tax=Geodia barretti TaxID=519541 RepID=A0AA35WUF1_GEOBA|nr:hypothetical protein GBAR_LOCUS15503 [Geodia barretti]